MKRIDYIPPPGATKRKRKRPGSIVYTGPVIDLTAGAVGRTRSGTKRDDGPRLLAVSSHKASASSRKCVLPRRNRFRGPVPRTLPPKGSHLTLIESLLQVDPLLPLGSSSSLTPISSGYSCANDYLNVMVPLHIDEALAQVLGQAEKLKREHDSVGALDGESRDTSVFPFTCAVTSVCDVGSGVVARISVSIFGQKNSIEFQKIVASQIYFLRGSESSNGQVPFRNLDVILLGHYAKSITEYNKDCQHMRPLFGVVNRAKRISNGYGAGIPTSLKGRMHELYEVQLDVDKYRLQSFLDHTKLPILANIWLIDSINTVSREYDALLQVGNLKLLQPLLNMRRKEDTEVRSLQDTVVNSESDAARTLSKWECLDENELCLTAYYRQYLRKSFNCPQHNAIIAATTRKGFTLIQGPPGTGKTTTLNGILNTLHLHVYSKYYGKLTRAMYVLMKRLRQSCRFDDDDKIVGTPKYADPSFWWESWQKSAVPIKPRILMAAPSNAAVDNLAYRILNTKFVDGVGSRFHPRMLRVGPGHGSILDVISLNKQVDAYLSSNEAKLRLEKDEAMARRDVAKSQLLKIFQFVFYELFGHNSEKTTRATEERLKRQFLAANEAYAAATEQFETRSIILEQQGRVGRDSLRRTLMETCVDKSEIVFSTLSSSGLKILESSVFPVCVVDEAAQSTEIATLIPLRLGCDQCILCGDPAQLSATVHSKTAKQLLYRRSLFERLQVGGHKVHFLSLQYRMHPLICSFPSQHFYGGLLKNGNADESSFCRPYHKYTGFSPLVFYDITEGQELLSSTSLSYSNEVEAQFCIELITRLCDNFKSSISPNRIGIIAMYSEQVKLLRAKYTRMLSKLTLTETYPDAKYIIRSVDGFQGQERDIILLSTVRADQDESKGVGFVSDQQRMNVALTRAKFSVFVVGRRTSLEQNSLWKKFIDFAVEQGVYLKTK
jgi:hypothetical protein